MDALKNGGSPSKGSSLLVTDSEKYREGKGNKVDVKNVP